MKRSRMLIPVLLVLVLFLSCAAPTLAANIYTRNIEVTYGITLQIDGKTPALKDAAGNSVAPFVFDGTTYVPIRAAAEALGASVDYDGTSNTAIIKSSGTQSPGSASSKTYDAGIEMTVCKYYSDYFRDMQDTFALIQNIASYPSGTSLDQVKQSQDIVRERYNSMSAFMDAYDYWLSSPDADKWRYDAKRLAENAIQSFDTLVNYSGVENYMNRVYYSTTDDRLDSGMLYLTCNSYYWDVFSSVYWS